MQGMPCMARDWTGGVWLYDCMVGLTGESRRFGSWGPGAAQIASRTSKVDKTILFKRISIFFVSDGAGYLPNLSPSTIFFVFQKKIDCQP